eukprot:1079863-Karenia_brevis.AAC.1
MASTPAKLDQAIKIMVNSFANTFNMFGLTINWKKGKSECLLRYWGINSCKHLESKRLDDGLYIP